MTVQSGPDLELQIAMVAVLVANTDLKSLIGSTPRIYQDVPATPTFPYVTIGEAQTVPDLAECIDGSEIFPVFHIWSRASGFTEAKKISATIWAALNGATLTLSQNKCVLLERDGVGDQAMRDPDGTTKHIASHYRAVCEPV
jgi:hypothetical protein